MILLLAYTAILFVESSKAGLIGGGRTRIYAERTRKSKATMKILNFILENARPTKKSTVADLAAGSGTYELLLKDKVKRIDAVELSDEMIKIMKEDVKAKNVRIIKADVLHSGLKSTNYDVVLFIMSLHHIKGGEKALDEAARLLKPNGRLILVDRISKNKLLNRFYDIIQARRRHVKGGFGHVYRSEAEIESMLSKNFVIKVKEMSDCKGFEGLIIDGVMWYLDKKVKQD